MEKTNGKERVREEVYVYYCEFCRKYLISRNGVFVHDNVYHPEDYTYKDGERTH